LSGYVSVFGYCAWLNLIRLALTKVLSGPGFIRLTKNGIMRRQYRVKNKFMKRLKTITCAALSQNYIALIFTSYFCK